METFETPDGPPLVQAGALALAFMRAVNAANWVELTAVPSFGDLRISPEQLALVNEHKNVLGYLKAGPPCVTLAVCPECELWVLVAGPGPRTCTMKRGCAGVPIKVQPAKWKAPRDGVGNRRRRRRPDNRT